MAFFYFRTIPALLIDKLNRTNRDNQFYLFYPICKYDFEIDRNKDFKRKLKGAEQMETIYVFTCGCELKAGERVRNKNKANSCPNHQDARFDHFIKECLDCGCKITPTSPNSVRCKSCQRKRSIEKNKAAKLKYLYGIVVGENDLETKQAAAAKTWKCKHRNQCIENMAYSNAKVLPCIDCDKYAPMKSKDLMEFSVKTSITNKYDSRNR